MTEYTHNSNVHKNKQTALSKWEKGQVSKTHTYLLCLFAHNSHTLSRPKYQLITYYIHSTHIMPTLIEGPHTVTLPVNKAKSRVVLRPLLHSGRFCIILSKYYEALLPNKSIKYDLISSKYYKKVSCNPKGSSYVNSYISLLEDKKAT